jgi:uncharacterized membrane protein HdeD (DUF308 family)
MLPAIFSNMATTLPGIASALIGAGNMIQAISSKDWSHASDWITQILAGLGLMLAKDGHKS